MLILGINSAWHDSSAAIVRDGEIVWAAEEERFSRIKHDQAFPTLAIREGLRWIGAEGVDVDVVSFGCRRPWVWELGSLGRMAVGRQRGDRGAVAGYLYGIAAGLRGARDRRPARRLIPGVSRIEEIDHHEAHAWSAFSPSGFERAAVVVADGSGTWQATSIYAADARGLKRRRATPFPNSLGLFYETFTEWLGFERGRDEWKVMGLAAYAEPHDPMDDLLRIVPGGYRLDRRCTMARASDRRYMLKRFGAPREPETPILDRHRALAASVQARTEAALLELAAAAVRLAGSRNLCMAGGVALNAKANGALLESGIVDELFVQPAAADDGTAVGAALAAAHHVGDPRPAQMAPPYWGPAYSADEIARILDSTGVTYRRFENVEAVVAQLLAEGHVVGWFRGRAEFGPRALGNRSILADPRDARLRDRVNLAVKYREQWRPFAPACVEERMTEFFEPSTPAPFMITTARVRPDKHGVLAAVTHADGTARVQSVAAADNPAFWRLLDRFGRLTGVPVLMNTSFNLRGEPIVTTPQDALRTFFASGLEVLVLEDLLVVKDAVRAALAAAARGAGEP